jgi:hypothetical protein
LEANLAADQEVINVTVTTEESVGDKHMTHHGSPDHHKVQLVPMFGSGMPPGQSMMRFGRNNGLVKQISNSHCSFF